MLAKNYQKIILGLIVLISLGSSFKILAPEISRLIMNHQPEDGKIFVASFTVVYDKMVYLSAVNQGRDGDWLFENNFTGENNSRHPIYLLYTALGQLSRLLNLSAEQIFLLARIVFGGLLIITVLLFIRHFVEDSGWRLIAYLLVFLSPCLSWYAANGYWLAFIIPDAFTMVRFFHFPHMLLANIIFLWALYFVYQSFVSNSVKAALIAGLLSFTLAFILTFHLLLLYTIVICLYIYRSINDRKWDGRHLLNTAIYFIAAIGPFIYFVSLGNFDQEWSLIEKQNVLDSPSLWAYVSGHGLIIAFAAIGIFLLRGDKKIFFGLWILITLLLSYAPFIPMQRRILETAFYVPIAIMAALGMMKIYMAIKKAFPDSYLYLLAWPILMLIIIIPLDFESKLFNATMSQKENRLFFIDKQIIEAIGWLKQTPKDAIIMSSPDIGNLIPFYSGRKTYVGHPQMTLNYGKKLDDVNYFLSGKSDPAKMNSFLDNNRISYVFITDKEPMSAIIRQQHPFLTEAYRNSSAVIYKYNHNLLP